MTGDIAFAAPSWRSMASITLRPIVLRAINEVTGRHYRSIEAFNDHPNTDHAQVVEVLARARTDLAVGHLAAIRARPSAPVGWGRRMVGWINGRAANGRHH